jgi:soluble lytic murein transglycosylase
MLQALRARNWAAAQRLATDPLGEKLVTFIRLLMPGEGSAQEIQDFLAGNASWPDQPALARRYDEALIREPDAPQTLALCRTHPPHAALSLLRCATLQAQSNDPAAAATTARIAWIGGITDPTEEAAFLARWHSILTPEDQRRRFDQLEPTSDAAAARQILRLAPPDRPLATARLAFRHENPAALSILAGVPEKDRADPALLLAEATYFRRTYAETAALDLWHAALAQAEAAAPKSARPHFWQERQALAYDLLAEHATQDAYDIANDAGLPPEQQIESDFLAGFIALRALQNATLARPHFAALAANSHSAISQARAQYWVARAAAEDATAKAAYAKAAAWPLTYYGQLAARAAGETEEALKARIAALRDPAATPQETATLETNELFRAADLLVAWQDTARAADFLLRLAQPPATAPQRALIAQAALRDGLPAVAVQTARLAGRDGTALPQSGWPMPVQPPPGPVPKNLVLGLMRQESSFDPKTTSPAGAHGLMQLMPHTAAELARAHHIPAGPLTDPAINMRLGTAYLADLLARFNGVAPYAIAAYDAGPNRVQGWIDADDAATPDGIAASMIDWIEFIPFAETRNYVQRVTENALVYAGREKK